MTVNGSAKRVILTVCLMSCSYLLAIPLPSRPAAAEQLQSMRVRQTAAASYDQKKRETNDISLNVVVSGLSCTCARFAEDIRNVVNELRPDGLRVLPVLGVGGLQNLNDVLFLKGIDMGVVDEDNLLMLKKRDPQLYANIEQRVQYITKLYNSEFHVLARNDIKSFADLRDKNVNFNLKDSQTQVSADVVFDALNINVTRSYYDNDEAIKKLRDGELAAMVILTGAPQAALAKLKAEDNVHFLPLETFGLPRAQKAALDVYLPGELTHEQYPNLIAEGTTVPTISNRALLVTYAWPEDSARYRRLVKFVDSFFGKIDQFRDGARHPKWKEVNIATNIPGWVRFKPAAEWLAVHAPADASAQGAAYPADVKAQFGQLVQYFNETTNHRRLSVAEEDVLFARFQQYLKTHH
jgi:TRAP-type uncharacterized transport system substrate-binding protein